MSASTATTRRVYRNLLGAEVALAQIQDRLDSGASPELQVDAIRGLVAAYWGPAAGRDAEDPPLAPAAAIAVAGVLHVDGKAVCPRCMEDIGSEFCCGVTACATARRS